MFRPPPLRLFRCPSVFRRNPPPAVHPVRMRFSAHSAILLIYWRQTVNIYTRRFDCRLPFGPLCVHTLHPLSQGPRLTSRLILTVLYIYKYCLPGVSTSPRHVSRRGNRAIVLCWGGLSFYIFCIFVFQIPNGAK